LHLVGFLEPRITVHGTTNIKLFPIMVVSIYCLFCVSYENYVPRNFLYLRFVQVFLSTTYFRKHGALSLASAWTGTGCPGGKTDKLEYKYSPLFLYYHGLCRMCRVLKETTFQFSIPKFALHGL